MRVKILQNIVKMYFTRLYIYLIEREFLRRLHMCGDGFKMRKRGLNMSGSGCEWLKMKAGELEMSGSG